jgi:hypothetical protein
MKHIPSPFEVGSYVEHPHLGLATVVDVKVNPRSADRITLLTLGGLVQFLAGSYDCKEWKPVE